MKRVFALLMALALCLSLLPLSVLAEEGEAIVVGEGSKGLAGLLTAEPEAPQLPETPELPAEEEILPLPTEEPVPAEEPDLPAEPEEAPAPVEAAVTAENDGDITPTVTLALGDGEAVGVADLPTAVAQACASGQSATITLLADQNLTESVVFSGGDTALYLAGFDIVVAAEAAIRLTDGAVLRLYNFMEEDVQATVKATAAGGSGIVVEKGYMDVQPYGPDWQGKNINIEGDYAGLLIKSVPEEVEWTNRVGVSTASIRGNQYGVAGEPGCGKTYFGFGDGSISGACGIYQPQPSSTTVIYGGSVAGTETGIDIRGGELTVADWDNEYRESPSVSGGKVGIAVVQGGAEQPVEVTINGGKIAGEYALLQRNAEGQSWDASSPVDILITGCTFECTAAEGGGCVVSDNDCVSITGGRYNRPDHKAFLADYYTSNLTDGVYRISLMEYDRTQLLVWENGGTRVPVPAGATWTSGNSAVAVVESDGGNGYVLRGVSAGRCDISYTDADGTSGKFRVYVSASSNYAAVVGAMLAAPDSGFAAPEGTELEHALSLPQSGDMGGGIHSVMTENLLHPNVNTLLGIVPTITVSAGGQELGQIEKTDQPLRFSIALTDELSTEEELLFRIFRVKNNGTGGDYGGKAGDSSAADVDYAFLPCELNADQTVVSFETDVFDGSQYYLVVEYVSEIGGQFVGQSLPIPAGYEITVADGSVAEFVRNADGSGALLSKAVGITDLAIRVGNSSCNTRMEVWQTDMDALLDSFWAKNSQWLAGEKSEYEAIIDFRPSRFATDTMERDIRTSINSNERIATVYFAEASLQSADAFTYVVELDEPVSITMPIPAEMLKEERSFNVVKIPIIDAVNNGGVPYIIEKLPATVSADGKSITVEADLFSYFALIYGDPVPVPVEEQEDSQVKLDSEDCAAKLREELEELVSKIVDITNTDILPGLDEETAEKVDDFIFNDAAIKALIEVNEIDRNTEDDKHKGDIAAVTGSLGEEEKILDFIDLSILIAAQRPGSEKHEHCGHVTELQNPMDFRFPVPEELRGKGGRFWVHRVHNGRTERIEGRLSPDGKYICFTTDCFSTYAFSYDEQGAPPVLWGDADGNGKVNARDATVVLRFDAGVIGETALNMAAADVDGNGDVNARDATYILRKDAGVITQFPAEQTGG